MEFSELKSHMKRSGKPKSKHGKYEILKIHSQINFGSNQTARVINKESITPKPLYSAT